MTVDTAHPPSVSESASRLQHSLLQLLNAALIATNAGTLPSEKISLLSNATPIFGQLRAIARTAHDQSRMGKRKVAEARLEVDDRSLSLQNLKYQKRHLEEEIRMCRDFRSIYQTIPLIDLDDFKARAKAEYVEESVLGDPHDLQLARLRFELSERQRLEAEKQSIQAERGSLIKENKEKKQRLEKLEADLKEMLTNSDAIWQQFEEPKAEVESGTVSQSADTPRPGEVAT